MQARLREKAAEDKRICDTDALRAENRRLKELLTLACNYVPRSKTPKLCEDIDAALATEPASGEAERIAPNFIRGPNGNPLYVGRRENAPPPTQDEELERKLFYDDRGIYIGDTRAQAIRTLIHALNLAVSRGCDHCAETIRQARALFAAEHTQGSGE